MWHKTLSLLSGLPSLHCHFLLSATQAEGHCHEIAELPSKMVVQSLGLLKLTLHPHSLALPLWDLLPLPLGDQKGSVISKYCSTAVMTPV